MKYQQPTPATDAQLLAIHERNVHIVCDAVAALFPKFRDNGLAPIAIFEGAIKGGALALMAGDGTTPAQVADLLQQASTRFRAIGSDTKPKH